MNKVKSILGGVLANLWQVPLAAVIIMTVIALMLSSVRMADADNGASVAARNDSDGDRIVDTVDVDDDNDAIPDTLELTSAGDDRDTDGDGVPDRLDLDSDNDGIPDWQESGISMQRDISSLRLVGARLVGAVGENGLLDVAETSVDSGALAYALNDSDAPADGVPDVRDLDSDNDGIPDLREGGVPAARDANRDARIDAEPGTVGQDGILDALQSTVDLACCDFNGDGIDDAVPPNTDLTDLPDYLDLDSDNDAVSDLVEMGGIDRDSDGRIDNFIDRDQPADGLDDALLSAPLASTDLNGNALEDQLDPFATGHRGVDSNTVDSGVPGVTIVYGDTSDELPAVAPVQTGLGASGCSVVSDTTDVMLVLLVIAAVALHGWRITLRQGVVRQGRRSRIEQRKAT